MTVEKSKWSKQYWADLGERVGATFLGALVASGVLTGATSVDWTDAKAIWIVLGAPTAFSLVKGLLANLKNSDSGPSMLPSPPAPDVTTGG